MRRSLLRDGPIRKPEWTAESKGGGQARRQCSRPGPAASAFTVNFPKPPKADANPLAFASAVRTQVSAVDPLLAIVDLSTLDDVVSRSVKSERAQTVLMGAFGILALLLAVIGIYGITAQLVAARVPEIGVRMTLGAGPRDVLRQFVGEGLRNTAIGIVLGLVAGTLLMRLAEKLLFQVKPWDPATLAGVSGLLLLAALLACVIPARRAMQVDPATAIRE